MTYITLRPATAGDLPFVRSLYLDNMRAVTARVLAWDEARQTASFHTRFLPAEVSVVVLEGRDIGLMQVAEREDEFFLKQFFIVPRFQRRGIGTGLLQALIERAAQAGKAVDARGCQRQPCPLAIRAPRVAGDIRGSAQGLHGEGTV